MSEERKQHWTAEECRAIYVEVMRELNIAGMSTVTVGPISCGPDGLTREEVKNGLRMLAMIPDDGIDPSRPFAMHGRR